MKEGGQHPFELRSLRILTGAGRSIREEQTPTVGTDGSPHGDTPARESHVRSVGGDHELRICGTD